VAKLTIAQIAEIDVETATRMARPELIVSLVAAAEMVRRLANQAAADSSNSSRPPSSDSPYQRDQGGNSSGGGRQEAASGEAKLETAPVIPPGEKNPEKPSGKRPGMPGFWRRQPIVVHGEVPHRPDQCGACHATLGADKPSRLVSAHNVLDLERGEMTLQISAKKHCYFAVRCDCDHETVAQPGTGASSQIESRKRDLLLSERCLVGPMLATFIAAMAVRMRLSREKIREFLLDWLGLELSKATVNRCIHEFGLVSEPVVEELIAEVSPPNLPTLTRHPGTRKASSSGCG